MAETEGFEPSIRGKPYNGLANRRLQPLGHVSVPPLMPDGPVVCKTRLQIRLPNSAITRSGIRNPRPAATIIRTPSSP